MKVQLFCSCFRLWFACLLIAASSVNQSVALTITNQPRNATVLGGATATFTVGPSGQSPFQFQWLFSGAPISGATTNPLVLSSVQTNQSGTYSVVVSDALDTIVSSNALLTVLPLQIVTQPQSQFGLFGSSLIFSTVASGQGPFAYQWQRAGVALPDATKQSLTISNVQLSDAANYSVIVSNQYGAVTSSNALLTTHAVAVWGDNLYGATNVPLSATNAIALAAGDHHCIALRADGSVVGWGFLNTVPVDLTNAVAIGAGSTHCLAARSDGALSLWGFILGSGQTNVPSSATNVIGVAAGPGAQHALVLETDGTPLDWGGLKPALTNPPPTATDLISVSAGSFHAVGLRPDGRVIAWGDNSFGQTNVPASATNVIAISAGWYHTAALRTDGKVVTWGSGPSGSIPPAPSAATNLVDVASPGNNVMALKRDGTLVQWAGLAPKFATNLAAIAGGSYDYLVLVAQGPPVIQGVPMTITVNTGTTNFLRRKATGALPLSYRWQFNGSDIAGATNAVLTLTNVQPDQANLPFTMIASNRFGMATSPPIFLVTRSLQVWIQPTNLFSVVAANPVLSTTVFGKGPFTYQWSAHGTNISWATNDTLTLTNAQLSDSGDYSVLVTNPFGAATANASVMITPTIITNAPKDQSIFFGGTVSFSIGLQAAIPLAYQWFFNGTAIPAESTNFLTFTNTQYAQAGIYSVIVSNAYEIVTNSATLSVVPVAAWGSLNQSMIPAIPTNIIAIAAGDHHALGLTSDGRVVAWGDTRYYDYGQTQIPAGLSNVIAVTAGYGSSLALSADGIVVPWGNNRYHQAEVPSGLTNVVAIASGDYHNLSLCSDGTVVAWGNNDYGQTNVPAALSNVVAIAAGEWNSMALRADGTVVAWGAGAPGSSGEPNHGQSSVPPGLNNVIQITTGGPDDLALKGDGSIVGWGANFDGENTPPAGLSNVVAIANGYTHTLALTADGAITAWGYNGYGETIIPTGLRNVIAVRASSFSSMALVSDHPPILHVPVSSMRVTSNAFSVVIPSESGRVYLLEYKNSLAEQSWIALPLVAGTGHPIVLSDPGIQQSPQRFYRIRRW